MCNHDLNFCSTDLATANRLLVNERDAAHRRCAHLQECLRTCQARLAERQGAPLTSGIQEADIGGTPSANTLLASLGHLVAAHERWRQINEYDFEAKNDDRYVNGELVAAALCFAMPELMPQLWPWPGTRHVPLKPKFRTEFEDRLSDLAKAAALLMAEIDRLLRSHQRSGGQVAQLGPVSEALRAGGGRD